MSTGMPSFAPSTKGVLTILVPIENLLLWIPWWLVLIAVSAAAWKILGRRLGIVTFVLLLVVDFLGMHDLAMQTLAIVVTSTLIALGFGMPLGILGAKNDRFDSAMRPILDSMQTMPSFVYLIPALMLFGPGQDPRRNGHRYLRHPPLSSGSPTLA